MIKLYIFDADGTLTPLREGATGPTIWELLPGRAEKCRELRNGGAILAIASNQSFRRPRHEIIAQLRFTQFSIDAATYRFSTRMARRKPNPDMLLELCRSYSVAPADAMFVGDQETDRQAAEAAGVGFAWANQFFGGGDYV